MVNPLLLEKLEDEFQQELENEAVVQDYFENYGEIIKVHSEKFDRHRKAMQVVDRWAQEGLL